MKKWKFRLISALLAGIMLLTLCSCGSTDPGTQSGPNGNSAGNTGGKPGVSAGKTKLEYVYRPEILDMPEGLDDVSRCFAVDGKLYLYGMAYGEAPESVLIRMNPDGSDPVKIVLTDPKENDDTSSETSDNVAVPLPMPRSKIAVATTATVVTPELPADDEVADGEGVAVESQGDEDEGPHVDEYSHIGNVTVDNDGGFWYVETINRTTYTDPEDYANYNYEEFQYLRHKDADGNDLLRFDLYSLLDDEEEDPYLYISTLVIDNAGNVVLLGNEQLWILDSDCKLLHKMEIPEGFNGFGSLVCSGEGIAVVGLYNEQYLLSHLCTLDSTAGVYGEPIALSNADGELSANKYYDLFSAYTSGICLNDRENIYHLDLTTGERTCLLNWINSDVDINEISYICAVSDKEFIACGYNNIDYKTQMMKLTYVEPADVQEKIILTLATSYLSYETRRAVINFNRSNDLYRIQVRDYSSYDGIVTGSGENIEYDWNAGVNRLNADIAAGDIPDILEVDSRLPMSSYSAKGLFADLYPYIDSDPEINREMLCENVLRAMEYNGKLETITTNFNIYTVVGKKSVVGEPADWTMEKMASLLKGRPENTVLFSERTREDFMTSLIAMSMDNYIDSETGLCRFDSEDFVKLLEISASFPEEIVMDYDNMDWDAYYRWFETQYREEDTLLMISYLGDFRSYRRIAKGQFGEEISLVGFPNSTQGSGSALMLGSRYAISSKSANGEGAWQFLRYFISDEYYGDDNIYGFPLRRDYLEKAAEQAMIPDTYEDENGNPVEIPNTYYFQDHEIDLGYPDQAEIDFLTDFVLSVDTLYRTDEKLMNIILEDAGSYYAGTKTAQDVAGLIQSRAQIYISESR